MDDAKNSVVLCSCGDHPAVEPHVCPYESEMYDDNETLCTCCDACMNECADEI